MSVQTIFVAPAEAGAAIRLPQPVAFFVAAPASAGATWAGSAAA